MTVDKIRHGKKKEEEESDYAPSGNEESEEDEDGEEEEIEEEKSSHTDGERSDVNEEEIPSKIKPVKQTLKAVILASKVGKKQTPTKKEAKITPRKRKTVEKIESDVKKRKKKVSSNEEQVEEEAEDEVNEKEEKKTKKIEKDWNTKNADFNLHNEAPENITQLKIIVSSSVMVITKMLEATPDNKGLNYDMAVMAFCRKTRANKSFEFNLPMSMAPNIKEAMELIIEKNKNIKKKRLQLPNSH